jgi:hypothetical protein
MKALLNAIKLQQVANAKAQVSEDIYFQLGARRYDFILYADGSFGVRQSHSGLTSVAFKATATGVRNALTWIELEEKLVAARHAEAH